MRGDRESSIAPSATSHISITQGRTTLFNDSEKGLLKCQQDGSHDTSNEVACMKQPQGRWKTAHLTSVMETSSKSPLWHIKLSKQSWERLRCLSVISWQGCTVNAVQHSKNRITVLCQCVNHGNGRLSVSRVISARNQALFNPWGDSEFNDWTVLEIRLKYHWQIRLAKRNFRKEAGSLPPTSYLLRKCSISTKSKQEGDQYNAISNLNLSLAV